MIRDRQPVGCLVALIAINALLMAPLAASFAGGPFSSAG